MLHQERARSITKATHAQFAQFCHATGAAFSGLFTLVLFNGPLINFPSCVVDVICPWIGIGLGLSGFGLPLADVSYCRRLKGRVSFCSQTQM